MPLESDHSQLNDASPATTTSSSNRHNKNLFTKDSGSGDEVRAKALMAIRCCTEAVPSPKVQGTVGHTPPPLFPGLTGLLYQSEVLPFKYLLHLSA